MKKSITYKISILLASIVLVLISIYFLLMTIDSAVSKQYEVFNPKDTFYYSTLKSEPEKSNYIQEVEHNNFIIKAKLLTNFVLMILSFVASIFVFRKLIYNNLNKIKT